MTLGKAGPDAGIAREAGALGPPHSSALPGAGLPRSTASPRLNPILFRPSHAAKTSQGRKSCRRNSATKRVAGFSYSSVRLSIWSIPPF